MHFVNAKSILSAHNGMNLYRGCTHGSTYDEALCRKIEPNVCTTRRRYEVLKEMQARRIPTIVWMTPDLPYINDTEENLNGILGYCKDAGVKGIIKFDFGVTLREGDREYLYQCFDKDFPGMKHLYQQKFGNAYIVPSPNHNQLMAKFRSFIRENNLLMDNQCFEYMHQFPKKEAPMPIQGELDFGAFD